jgi:hypothetical protein
LLVLTLARRSKRNRPTNSLTKTHQTSQRPYLQFILTELKANLPPEHMAEWLGKVERFGRPGLSDDVARLFADGCGFHRYDVAAFMEGRVQRV